MEGKNVLLAIVLSTLVLVIWYTFNIMGVREINLLRDGGHWKALIGSSLPSPHP